MMIRNLTPFIGKFFLKIFLVVVFSMYFLIKALNISMHVTVCKAKHLE